MTKRVKITDVTELQNLLDDFSPDRPYLNTYDIEDGVYADEAELAAWRRKGTITTRVDARSRVEPTREYVELICNGCGKKTLWSQEFPQPQHDCATDIWRAENREGKS